MKGQRIGFSLRYKLLLLLTVLPLVCLGLYLFMATCLFEKDKIAYVYDSSVAMARSLSAQVRLETAAFLDQVKNFVDGFDIDHGEFVESVRAQFGAQNRVEVLLVYRINPNNTVSEIGRLNKNSPVAKRFMSRNGALKGFYSTAIENGSFFTSYGAKEPFYSVIVQETVGKNDGDRIIVVGLYRTPELSKSFESATLYRSFLLSSKGDYEAGPMDKNLAKLEGVESARFFAPVFDRNLPEGTLERSGSSGKQMLVAYSRTGQGDQVVVSVVDKAVALMAVNVMIEKSIMFFIALLSSTVIISVVVSKKLTISLSRLLDATREIAAGNFSIRVKDVSNDEVGGLAEGFNFMAGKVSALMEETAEKARMEAELATAQTVQETLFPDSQNRFGAVEIIGHYESVSECGGDWWHCSEFQGKIFLWIGDATGPGAPAALVTSAARSAASIIEGIPNVGPGKALKIMNKAIHEVSRGKINMTFFLGANDVQKGIMTYANASHEAPFLLRKLPRAPRKADLIPLLDVNGCRLGERKESDYLEGEVGFSHGDSLVLYTDGITDLENSDGKNWGERRFVRSIVRAFGSHRDAPSRFKIIVEDIEEFRGPANLVEDVTMMGCQFEDVV